MAGVDTPKLLVINQYYKPDLSSTGQIAATICESLVAAGFRIHVLTGQPSYTSESPGAPAYELLNGVHVHRVPMGRSRGRESMYTRVSGYLGFLSKAWFKARSLTKSCGFDGVVTFHNPPFVGLLAGYLVRRNAGLVFTYILQDIHPDVLRATRSVRLPRLVFWLWERLNHVIFKHARKIVVLSQGMRETLIQDKKVAPGKVEIISLWGQPELVPEVSGDEIRQELGIGEYEILLLYSGNMGVMHPLDPILDAASRLGGSSVRFLFVGGGAKRSALVERARSESLGNVDFLPYQSTERFAQVVAAADACIVALEPGLERLALPSRAFTFLSGGRPLINLMAPSAELAQITEEHGCGWTVRSGEELSELVCTWLEDSEGLKKGKEKARKLYDEHFRRDRIIQEYVRVLSVEPNTE